MTWTKDMRGNWTNDTPWDGTQPPADTPTTTQPNTTTNTSDTKAVEVKPVRQDLWDQYTSIASRFGVTPMSIADFNSKMGDIGNYGNQGQEKIDQVNKSFGDKILRTVYDSAKSQIKTNYDKYWQAQKDNGTEIPYALPDVGSFTSGSDIQGMLTNLDSSLSNAYDTSVHNATNTPTPLEKFDETPYTATMETLNSQANAADVATPTYAYDPSTSQKYFDAIKASEQAGTDKAVSAVNETANFTNPYATGSGSQIKATASMLDNITANQQARAYASGENAYRQNYSTALLDADRQRNVKSAAFDDRLALIKYLDAMKTAKTQNERDNAKNLYDASQGAAKLSYDRAAQERADARQTALLEEAAKLNAPQKQEWWQPFATAAVSGLAQGVGIGATGAVAKWINPSLYGAK
jgi:hypothetical protein